MGVGNHLDSHPEQAGSLQGAVQPDNLLRPADTRQDPRVDNQGQVDILGLEQADSHHPHLELVDSLRGQVGSLQELAGNLQGPADSQVQQEIHQAAVEGTRKQNIKTQYFIISDIYENV